jgi:uncharacterized membrane protein YdfJ with MMPL/SSD domain
MMLFAIVFGLSIDYEVFLLSRIRERFDAHRRQRRRRRDGLARTARLIFAAAAIMVCVFGAFALLRRPRLQMLGLGLAVAIAVDATLVRLVLVPATMELLGDRNWWLPGPGGSRRCQGRQGARTHSFSWRSFSACRRGPPGAGRVRVQDHVGVELRHERVQVAGA